MSSLWSPHSSLLVAACSLLLPLAAAGVRAEGEDVATVGITTRGRPGDATCLVGKEVPAALRGDVQKLVDRAWERLSARDNDKLWELAGPGAAAKVDKAVFAAEMNGIAERIGTHRKDVPDDIAILTFVGNYNGIAVCGSRDTSSPDHRSFHVRSKGEEVAVAFRHSLQPPFKRTTAFMFRKPADSEWVLASIHSNATAFNGKTWTYYSSAADEFGHDKPLIRLLLLELGLAFSQPAPYVMNANSYEVGKKIQALLSDQAVVSALTRWSVGEAGLAVEQVTVSTTRTALRPQVVYLTDYDLDGEDIVAQASQIGAYIRSAYPELAQHFPDVLLEAVSRPLKELKPGYASHRKIEPLARRAE